MLLSSPQAELHVYLNMSSRTCSDKKDECDVLLDHFGHVLVLLTWIPIFYGYKFVIIMY